MAHPGVDASQLGTPGWAPSAARGAFALLQLSESGGNHLFQLRVVKGLIQNWKGNGKLRLEETAGDDDFFVGAVLLEEADPVIPAEDIHAIIGHDESHPIVEKLLDRSHPIRGHDYFVPFVLQIIPQGQSDRILILDDQNIDLLILFHSNFPIRLVVATIYYFLPLGQRQMSFQDAIEDYRYLKNRGYPDKAALKLVSDHHRLNSVLRNCLFRAIFAYPDCENRRSKLMAAGDVEGHMLGVDWYNVLITVESYLKGFPVFISDDGLVRDSSGVHGSYKPGKITERGIGEILSQITALKPSRVELFLDAPISFSGDMAEELRSRLSRTLSVPYSVSVFPSADYPLKSFDGIVATADSIIIDRVQIRRVFDLARHVVETSFGTQIPAVRALGE